MLRYYFVIDRTKIHRQATWNVGSKPPILEDFAETSPALKRGLRQLFVCLQGVLQTDLSKLQRLQMQTSDVICLGQKLSTMTCLQGTQAVLKCLTMAKRQRKKSLARGSMAMNVGEEILELQVEWFDTSVFLRLTSLKLV